MDGDVDEDGDNPKMCKVRCCRHVGEEKLLFVPENGPRTITDWLGRVNPEASQGALVIRLGVSGLLSELKVFHASNVRSRCWCTRKQIEKLFPAHRSLDTALTAHILI